MEPGRDGAGDRQPGLAATLFTAAGKMATIVDLIDTGTATLTAGEGWSDGSIAILIRHGVRVFGTLRRGADGTALVAFDDPLEGWRRDLFIDRRRSSRPIVIKERLAA